jgi:hypothetical protein
VHWQIVDSTYFSDSDPTANVTGGLTDEGSTFVPGELKDAGNTTGTITLDTDEFTEIEFAVKAIATATDGGDYCFRLVAASGTSISTYTVYAQISLSTNAPNLTQTHYRWRNDDGGEGGFDTGTGVDGSVTINSSQNLNSDVLGSNRSTNPDGILTTVSADPTGTAISVASTTGFATGDEILLINMQGASGDTADVGNYEFLIVDSVPDGTTLNLATSVQKSYDGTNFANQKVVVQRVPQWTDVTIQSGGTLTVNDWAGSGGGLMVFRATCTVDVQSGGAISADALGYRGGPTNTAASYGDWRYLGEGFAGGYNTAGVDGSPNSEGGGPGRSAGDNDASSGIGGGGGGGYGTAGTDGTITQGSGFQGLGGATYGTSELSQLFLGSAGGSGGHDTDNSARDGGAGGDAGGIILISADTISVSGTMSSNGDPGDDSVDGGCGGGGGSGGSILLQANSAMVGTSLVTATGSSGGQGNRACDGGDGGDGLIRIEADTISGTTIPSASTSGTPGGGSGASWAQVEDSALTNLTIETLRRLRFLVSNEGDLTSGAVTYRLQVAETGDCGSGTYSDVPVTPVDQVDHWQIVSSSYITDGEATSNIDGLQDPGGGTYVPGELKDEANTTGEITLEPGQFTEIEFVIKATPSATDGGSYCFRLYDATHDSPLGTYTEYAQTTLAHGIFSYRKPITIPAANVSCSTDMDDFPILINITDADLAGKAQAEGYDIIFRALDDTICDDLGPAPCTLDHEVEKWDSGTGELVAWVRIPKLSASSDTIIYMYYGNPNVYQSPENPTGVWESNYKGVWHLNQDPAGTAPQMLDSTSNVNHGTATGGTGAVTRVKYATGSGNPNATATFGATPTEGNLLIAISSTRKGDDVPEEASLSGSGWTRPINNYFKTVGSTGDRRGLAVFYKIAGASEPTGITTSWTHNDESTLLIQ